MSITESEYQAMRERLKMNKCDKTSSPDAFTGKESELHRQIEADLKLRRWMFVHSRTDMATTTAKGVPDFLIFPGNGKVLFVEVKTKTGKLSPEQRAWQYCSDIRCYQYHVIRSFAEWQRTAETFLTQN